MAVLARGAGGEMVTCGLERGPNGDGKRTVRTTMATAEMGDARKRGEVWMFGIDGSCGWCRR